LWFCLCVQAGGFGKIPNAKTPNHKEIPKAEASMARIVPELKALEFRFFGVWDIGVWDLRARGVPDEPHWLDFDEGSAPTLNLEL
jgi:hypothetical protein